MTRKPLRLVLDTNVVASAILWGGAPRQLLESGREQSTRLFTSLPLLAELTDILGRQKFARKIVAAERTLVQLVDGYANLAAVVRPIITPRVAPDPDDDVVVGTALAAKAHQIVTGDKAFLSIGSHQGIQVVSVANAIALLGMTRLG